MHAQVYVQIPPVFYRTLPPFGATALLTLNKWFVRARTPMTFKRLVKNILKF